MSTLLVNKIYNSRKYILEILNERGLDISEYENFTMDELHSMMQNQQLDLLVAGTDKKVYVKYYLSKTLKQNNLYDFIEDLYNIENVLNKQDDLMIIYKDEPNETLLNNIKEIWLTDNIYISIINIERLQYNILKHEMVPKHTILSLEEKNELKDKFNITDDEMLPNISYFGPVSQLIGIRPGDICKIDRNSKTAIDSTFYRICII